MLNALMQLIGLAVVVVGLFYAERFLSKAFAGKPYAQRFRVWRDQLLVLVGLTFAAVLLHFIGIHMLGKFATVLSNIALVVFVRENLDYYVVSSQRGKRALKLVSYTLIIFILVQAIL